MICVESREANASSSSELFKTHRFRDGIGHFEKRREKRAFLAVCPFDGKNFESARPL